MCALAFEVGRGEDTPPYKSERTLGVSVATSIGVGTPLPQGSGMAMWIGMGTSLLQATPNGRQGAKLERARTPQ